MRSGLRPRSQHEDERDQGYAGQHQKCRLITRPHHRKPSHCLADRPANSLNGADKAASDIIAPGPSHDVGQKKGQKGIEQADPHAIQHLNGNQPGRIVG